MSNETKVTTEEVIPATPDPPPLADTDDVAEGDAAVATAAAEADAAIVETIDELSQADAALATWMGELDEKTDRNAEEVKGLRSWATEFQSQVSAALEGQGNILSQIMELVSPKKPETPPTPSESSASEKGEKEAPAEKDTKPPAKAEVPLMDESAGARRKKLSWI